MASYEEIKDYLERQVHEARVHHHTELLDRHRTAAALAHALRRLEEFTLHGLIPEEFSEEMSDGGQ